jgi:hypothetical protein
MPPIYPTAITMTFELAAYGFLSGLLYKKLNVYTSLIGAMIGGRIVSGVANALLLGMAGRAYGFVAFVSESFITALPGIIVQIVLIPPLIIVLQRARLTSKPDKK